MDSRRFLEKSTPMIEYMVEWRAQLPSISLDSILLDAGGADHVGIMLVDLIEGFVRIGSLASPRIEALVRPIFDMVVSAEGRGVRSFISVQDTHPSDSPEFDDFGPHCMEGTPEAQIVRECASLPFFNAFVTIPKKSLNAFLNSGLSAYMRANPQLSTMIIVGDCTDLCVYQTAMHLKMMANARDEMISTHQFDIIVAGDLVGTYDLDVGTAAKLNLKPHDGDFFHLVFLYHLHLNGIRVVAGITGH